MGSRSGVGRPHILFFNSKYNRVCIWTPEQIVQVMNVIKFKNNPDSRTPSSIDHTKRIGRYMGVHPELGDVAVLVEDEFLDEAMAILND